MIVAMQSLETFAQTHQTALHVTGPAVEATLAQCFDGMAKVCLDLALHESDAMALQLITDEVCTNIATHGYRGREPGPLSLSLLRPNTHAPGELGSTLVILITDRGHQFHPDNAAQPDLEADVDEREIGGLGWFLVKEVSDSLSYEHDNGLNTTCITRRLRGAAE
jgi:anti-sigma regulatory factor (Ser/Thr protein kinase)